jgi:hypothetical protein
MDERNLFFDPNNKEATMSEQTAQQSRLPTPDPALKRLDRFVGTWSMEGHLVGSKENDIKGEATYRWLPGGFFLEQRINLDFMGMQIDSLELIGYDPENQNLSLNGLLERVAYATAVQVGGRRRHSHDLGLIRSAGCNF